MAERADTKLIGLRGLYIEAQRRQDVAAAQSYAEEAANAAPALAWAGHAVLEFRCAAGDWAGALTALDRCLRHGLADKADYQRKRAVLLTAQALAAEEGDRDAARSLALEALKLVPTLVPAAELAGRLLGEAGELRRAIRVIEKPGRPIRTRISRIPTRTCVRAIPRASGWRVCSRWRRRPRAMSRARWRWRRPRSMRRNSPPRARRSSRC
jgi:tetratricopeptide (TPR) repeat protein